MVKIEINFEKRHLYFLALLFGIAVGILVVNAYNSGGAGGVPAVFGHSVDEMDWNRPIQTDAMIIGNQTSPSGPDLTVGNKWGGLVSGGEGGGAAFGVNLFTRTGRNILSAYANESGYAGMWVHSGQIDFFSTKTSTSGWVPINAQTKMTFDNGNLDIKGNLSVGRTTIHGERICREILVQPLGGSQSGVVNVPYECSNSKCLILIENGGIGPGAFEQNFVYAYYQQTQYVMPNGGNFVLWSTEGSGGDTVSSIDQTETAGVNGVYSIDLYSENSKSTEILGFTWGGGYVRLYDDGGSDNGFLSWYWQSRDNGFRLWVCT